ncbi:MAG: hypothetical protein ABI068_03115, partial [Ktedonobacterales bacterium]
APGATPKSGSRLGLFFVIGGIVLVAVLVAVLLVVGSLGLLAYYNSQHPGGNSSTATGATATPGVTSNIIFQDSLTSNTNGWADDGTNCTFKNGSYHVKGAVCLAPLTSPAGDATVRVSVKRISGAANEPYGLTLRHASRGNFYDFVISGDGAWAVFLHKGGNTSLLHPYTNNAAIHQGLGVSNILKVVMSGSTFHCYVNDTLVGQFTDSSFASGEVGVSNFGTGTTVDAAFNNFEVDRNG